ncbi:uncharacterized protein LOC130769166 [Actinidia eriantha]|uniref:uncharacterized protein LOC130769166 n=1 Tax=Actinidia eriantha TaxID=165200 RepID=UPI002590AB25|nr:uncharacterized protein LOC130769166 [Actinidia eriantha]
MRGRGRGRGKSGFVWFSLFSLSSLTFYWPDTQRVFLSTRLQSQSSPGDPSLRLQIFPQGLHYIEDYGVQLGSLNLYTCTQHREETMQVLWLDGDDCLWTAGIGLCYQKYMEMFDGGRNVTEQAAAEEEADIAEENDAEEDIENSSTGMGIMKRMKKYPIWMKDYVI